MSIQRLYIGNIPYGSNPKELTAYFERVCSVGELFVPEKSMTGLHRNFAIVVINGDEEMGTRCIKVLNGIFWKGSKLRIEKCKAEYYKHRMEREKHEELTKAASTEAITIPTVDLPVCESKRLIIKKHRHSSKISVPNGSIENSLANHYYFDEDLEIEARSIKKIEPNLSNLVDVDKPDDVNDVITNIDEVLSDDESPKEWTGPCIDLPTLYNTPNRISESAERALRIINSLNPVAESSEKKEKPVAVVSNLIVKRFDPKKNPKVTKIEPEVVPPVSTSDTVEVSSVAPNDKVAVAQSTSATNFTNLGVLKDLFYKDVSLGIIIIIVV